MLFNVSLYVQDGNISKACLNSCLLFIIPLLFFSSFSPFTLSISHFVSSSLSQPLFLHIFISLSQSHFFPLAQRWWLSFWDCGCQSAAGFPGAKPQPTNTLSKTRQDSFILALLKYSIVIQYLDSVSMDIRQRNLFSKYLQRCFFFFFQTSGCKVKSLLMRCLISNVQHIAYKMCSTDS